jgi:putative ABC transport system permease protein
MIRNYLLVAFRSIFRNRLHSLINIAGLALGIAGGILIFSYVQYELSYDSYHKNSDRIYRVTLHVSSEDDEAIFATNYPNVYREMLPNFPEIEYSTRLLDRGFSGTSETVRVDDKVFINQTIYHADSTFFRVFQYRMLAGNPEYALNGLNKAVVTKSTALRYYGTTDVLGKRLTINDGEEFAISGVMEDVPGNTHFNFNMLLTMGNLYWEKQANWNGLIFSTYFLLREGSTPESVTARINQFFENDKRFKDPAESKKKIRMPLQPIEDIHLTSHMRFELLPNSEYKYVIIFSSIAIFIILIACINYINLATARAMERAREVGLRKAFGAYRTNLVIQFLGESLITVAIAFIAALGIIELMRPSFNELTDMNFSYAIFFSNGIWIKYLTLLVVIALISGLYPAFILSGFKPDRVLKGQFKKSKTGNLLRKNLVVFQFLISVFLIIGSLVIYKQMNHIRNKNLGIDKDQIVVVQMQSRDVKRNHVTIKSELEKYHNILSSTAVSQVPINVTLSEGISFNMGWSNEDPQFNYLETDKDFFETMGVEIVRGFGFTREYSEDYTDYLVNEAGSELLRSADEDILGKNIRVKHDGITLGPIVGVVKDFNFASLHNDIGPLVICQNPGRYSALLFKIRSENIDETLSFMDSKWKELSNGTPFDYSFLDEEFDRIYKTENRAGQLFIAFMVMAIFIACIGLFGLTSYSTIQRTKEVGIRKALGSTVFGITCMFLKENIRLIIIAFVMAIPLGYYFMLQWLADFAYKINLDWKIFLFAGSVVLIIAVITVSFHAIKAALINPADSLRYE